MQLKTRKAPVAFHSQVLRCLRLAIAPIMLPQQITIKTKIKKEKNDSKESNDSTLSISPSVYSSVSPSKRDFSDCFAGTL